MGEFLKTRKTRALTSKQLKGRGFRYNHVLSEDNVEVYSYRFPVYKNNNHFILECEFNILLPNNELQIEVYDNNSRAKYAPFYYFEYGDYSIVLDIIHKNIEKQLNKMGVIKYQKRK